MMITSAAGQSSAMPARTTAEQLAAIDAGATVNDRYELELAESAAAEIRTDARIRAAFPDGPLTWS